MTLIDMLVLGIIKKHTDAQRIAADIVDRWHEDKIPGELTDVLGLSHREYQAWTTGNVSLLTIAKWRRTKPPALDPSKPWFRLSGRPGREVVGYLDQVKSQKKTARSAG